MNAKSIFDEAKKVHDYRLSHFGTKALSKLESIHLSEKFSSFKTGNPRIFDDIETNELDWDKFKSLAEMAFSLHLQMNTKTSEKDARSVRFG